MSFDHLNTIYRSLDIRGKFPDEISPAEVEKIGKHFDNISSDTPKDKLKLPFNKLYRFLKKLQGEFYS